jgi:hypothetical protein
VGGEWPEINASRLLVGPATRRLHLRKSPFSKKRKALNVSRRGYSLPRIGL